LTIDTVKTIQDALQDKYDRKRMTTAIAPPITRRRS
jgi:hypothetical protein